MKRLVLCLAALCLITPMIMAQSLATQLADVIDNNPISDRTFIAVQVADAETGDVLFERFPDHLMTPASCLKLYSSSCALEMLGPDHRFVTEVAINHETGDLILRGGGDPVLRTEDLRAMAAQIHNELGIEAIEGGVVVDASLFSSPLKGPGWMWDDDPDYYNMSISAIMLDYNVLEAQATGGNITLVPPSDYPPTAIVEGDERINRRPFEETITAGESATGTRSLTPHDPAHWVAGVFDEMLFEAGVEVADPPRVSTERVEGETILTHESMPLSEILPLFNKPSENAIGEMLIHMLAVEASQEVATWGTGADVISQWLTQEAGLRDGDFRIVDGSGLSRYDQICASGTVQLLRHMWQSDNRDVFIASLPNMGVDGTVRSRLSNLPNRVYAKTGTMSGVSCLSGYVLNDADRWLIFSILTNGYIGSSAPSRAVQDRLVEVMAESR